MKKIKITGRLTIEEFLLGKEISVTDEKYEELQELWKIAESHEDYSDFDAAIQTLLERDILDILNTCHIEFDGEGDPEFCDEESGE